MNPKRYEIKGTICAVRLESIDVPYYKIFVIWIN